MKKTVFTLSISVAGAMSLMACQSTTFKPASYQQPEIQSPAQYKYAGIAWIETSQISTKPQQWWEIYHDPILSTLIQQLDQDNLSIQQAQAKYRQAIALLDQQRANYAPSLNMGASAYHNEAKNLTKSRQFSTNLTASWIPDLWGELQKRLRANRPMYRLLWQILLQLNSVNN